MAGRVSDHPRSTWTPDRPFDRAAWEECARRIDILATRYQRPSLSPLLCAEELRQAGWLGVAKALRGFDPERGSRWWPYLYRRVSGEMLDYMRSILGDDFRRVQPRPFREVDHRAAAMVQGPAPCYAGLHRLLPRLSPRQREAVETILQDRPQVSMARRHGISEAAVSIYKRKALAMLKRKLKTEVLS